MSENLQKLLVTYYTASWSVQFMFLELLSEMNQPLQKKAFHDCSTYVELEARIVDETCIFISDILIAVFGRKNRFFKVLVRSRCINSAETVLFEKPVQVRPALQ